MPTKQQQYSADHLQNELLVAGQPTTPAPEQRYKSLKGILMIIFSIALSSFYFGYAMVYLSSIDFDTIVKLYDIQINRQVAQGILVACVPIGGGLGAVSSTLLIQRFSRRNCLLIINVMASIAVFLLYLPGFESFLMARLFQGFCTGLMSSVAPLMMKQLSPTQISGTLTSCHQIFITFGATFGFTFSLLLSWLMNDQTGQRKWWIVFGFPLIILVVQTWLLIFVFNFQTPKYLLLNHREQQARQLIARIYKTEHVDPVLKQMKMNLQHEPLEQEMQPRTTEQIKINSNKKQQLSHTQLQTPRSATIAALHLAVLQQLCGVNAIVAYGGEIVGQREQSLKMAMPIIINMLQFVGAIIASFLLTRIGRKLLLEIGALATAVGSLIVAIGFFNNSLLWILFGLVFFMACFGLTLGPVVWIYLPEVAQPKILSFATAANWATCSLVMLLFPILKDLLPGKNPAILFLFFSTWSIVSYFFNRIYVLQTRNKGQKQIFQEYKALKQFC